MFYSKFRLITFHHIHKSNMHILLNEYSCFIFSKIGFSLLFHKKFALQLELKKGLMVNVL